MRAHFLTKISKTICSTKLLCDLIRFVHTFPVHYTSLMVFVAWIISNISCVDAVFALCELFVVWPIYIELCRRTLHSRAEMLEWIILRCRRGLLTTAAAVSRSILSSSSAVVVSITLSSGARLCIQCVGGFFGWLGVFWGTCPSFARRRVVQCWHYRIGEHASPDWTAEAYIVFGSNDATRVVW